MTNIQKQYPLSPNTIGGKALEKLNPEERVEILQETTIWDDAYKINDEVYGILGENIGTATILEKIEDKNHPRVNGLVNWLKDNPGNQEWFLENVGKNFDLFSDGIMLLGSVFELENEKAPDNGKDIWNDEGNTYFTFDSAQDYAKRVGKKIPANWSDYTDFLPGDDENKVNFLVNVLGLSMAGLRSNDGQFISQRRYGYYWSSSPNGPRGHNLIFISDYIDSNNIGYRDYGFPVKCIKRRCT